MDFEQLRADLVNHPIQGYLPDSRRVDIHLISHVEDNLYVGGCIDGVDIGGFFSHVFSLYMWEKYIYDKSKTQHREVKMYDSARDPVDVKNVEGFSDEIVRALDEGGNVLVHCQAGINRSNLVAARVLMKRYGMSAKDAIAHLRSKRSDLVLANQTFERWLLNHDSQD